MRKRGATHVALAALASAVLHAGAAHAGNMDPTPERLVSQPDGPLPPNVRPATACQDIAADPNLAIAAGQRPQDFACRPNNAAFANYISELGFAIAPTSFYPARTTGVGGFQVSLEASYTRVSAGRSTPDGTRYWELGTRGAQDANTQQFSVRNASPDSILQIYALKARKGLPFGFEIAGSLGTIANSSLWVGGGDLRWSLLEGFRTGPLGYVPDIALSGGVRTLSGTQKFYLTTASFDVRVSKPITLADSAVLIPSLGFQRLVIFGDSNVVDSTPAVDPLQQCGYAGQNPTTGGPVCRNRYSNGQEANHDFSNNFTFERVRVHRNRGLFALNYRYEIIWIGSQIAFDITDPGSENPGIVGSRQWTLSFEAGVSF